MSMYVYAILGCIELFEFTTGVCATDTAIQSEAIIETSLHSFAGMFGILLTRTLFIQN